MLILAVSVLAAIWAVAMMTVPGRVGYVWFFMYAEYYMGVITLVSLSITIMVGLVSTDRLVLTIRQRVLLQSVHRTTGVIAVAALFVHVWTKVAEKNIGLIDVFIPFLSVGNRVYVGMGTISGWILVLVLWTGIARSRFIGRGKPWMWRGIHAISYLMWPIALMHGLGAGRAAKPWVIVSYLVCVLGVLVGLAVRLSVSLNRRKDFSSAAGAGITPVGKLVPTSSPAAKRPSRREQERVAAESMAPVAVVDAFQPVAPPVAAPPPPLPMEEVPVARQRRGGMEDRFDEPTGMISRRDLGYETDERPRGRRRDEEIEYEEPAPRGRRYADDDTITWNRREMRELEAPRAVRPEETGTRMRRPDMEDTGTRMRRSEMEDTGSWSRREMEDTGTRMRRPGPEDTGTRMRRPGPEDTGTRMRRSE
ncbi:MAG: translation initiation factor III, partial [Actinoplanes sp.]